MLEKGASRLGIESAPHVRSQERVAVTNGPVLPRPAVVVAVSLALGLLSVYLQHLAVPIDTPYLGVFGNQLDLAVY